MTCLVFSEYTQSKKSHGKKLERGLKTFIKAYGSTNAFSFRVIGLSAFFEHHGMFIFYYFIKPNVQINIQLI